VPLKVEKEAREQAAEGRGQGARENVEVICMRTVELKKNSEVRIQESESDWDSGPNEKVDTVQTIGF
jgi:hypothetical protein